MLLCRYGPLRQHWTMRYEAKHSYFKKLTQSIGNFINLPYTLALRHRKLQCYYRMDENDYKVDNVSIGPVRTCINYLYIRCADYILLHHTLFYAHYLS